MRILVILICGITLSACSGLMMSGGTGGSTKVEKDRPAQPQASNSAVSSAVMAKYAADPLVSKLGVDVSASGGMVTLSGTVPTYAARETAEKLAMATEGVKAVDNRINVEYQK
ncbi:MAG: BON domain-containing protein [Woeseiaceae bacterium]